MIFERFLEWARGLKTLKRRWIGCIVGCALWLFFIIFGFWATMLLLFLGIVGFIVGRVLEEHQSWKDVITKLIAERYGD